MQTVENFFVGSFLIANGRLGVNIKEDGCAALQLTRAADEDEQAPVNQGIYSMNPMQTYELMQKCGLAENLSPDWAKKYDCLFDHTPWIACIVLGLLFCLLFTPSYTW